MFIKTLQAALLACVFFSVSVSSQEVDNPFKKPPEKLTVSHVERMLRDMEPGLRKLMLEQIKLEMRIVEDKLTAQITQGLQKASDPKKASKLVKENLNSAVDFFIASGGRFLGCVNKRPAFIDANRRKKIFSKEEVEKSRAKSNFSHCYK